MAIFSDSVVLPHDPDLCVFMLSGGFDSLATLVGSTDHVKKPHAIYLNLGQKSGARQDAAAKRICLHLGLPLTVGNLPGMSDLFSALSEPPHPMVAELYRGENSQKAVSIAAAFAASSGAQSLYYGATAEDVAGSPFLLDMLKGIEHVVQLNTGRKYFTIEAPLASTSRPAVLRSVPAEFYSLTWSCLWGGLYHCGKCHGCKNRQQRFAGAGVADPTTYSEEFPA